jgi:DNA-binding protein H-NS
MTVQERRRKQHRANAQRKARAKEIWKQYEITVNELILQGVALPVAEASARATRKIAICDMKFRTHHSLGETQ